MNYNELIKSYDRNKKTETTTIQDIRKQTGLNQKQFAEKYKIQLATLRNWEQGRYLCPEYLIDLLQYKINNERNFSLKLSDKDMKKIYKKAASVGLTPEKLLESFIGDLVDGTHSNGSDERCLADEWFERCDFSLYSDKTLLKFLVKEDSLNYFFECIEDKESLIKNITESESKINGDWYKWQEVITTSRDCPEGKRAYNTRDEWVKEEKEFIEQEQEELSDIEKNINELWNSFLAWTDKSDVNFDKEVERVIEEYNSYKCGK